MEPFKFSPQRFRRRWMPHFGSARGNSAADCQFRSPRCAATFGLTRHALLLGC